MRAEGFRDLAHALEKSEIGAELVTGLGDSGQKRQDLGVLFAGIGLTSDRKTLG